MDRNALVALGVLVVWTVLVVGGLVVRRRKRPREPLNPEAAETFRVAKHEKEALQAKIDSTHDWGGGPGF